MLGIAIVEDDRDHAALLEAHIRQYAIGHHLQVSVRLFHDAVTFLDQYTADYQIVFMDIMMPMLISRMPSSIFTDSAGFLEKM